MASKLQERGLPAMVFGIDPPVLELPATEAPRLNGNGQDHPSGGNGSSEP